MNKLIHSQDLPDALLAASGTLAFLFEDGRHVKSAATSAVSEKLMRDNLPDDGHFGALLIAMGAGEAYSPNKNGDHFPEKELIDRHHTFVKNGHFFREHRNTDPKLAIGVVKASAFNDEMKRVELIVHGSKDKAAEEYEFVKAGKPLAYSMSCFPAGTLVLMADGTEKPIEQIKIGEEVRTHKGNVGKVSDTMARHYTGRGVKFRASGLPDYVVATEDHGVWCRPKVGRVHECPVCGGKFKVLAAHLWQKKDPQHVKARQNPERYMEGFTAAGNLVPGDLLRQAVDLEVLEPGDKNLAVIAGYYLSEGSVSDIECYSNYKGHKNGPYIDTRIEFCFHKDETAMVEELQAAFVAAGFKKPTAFPKKGGTAQTVRSHSKVLGQWLLENCGKYATHKRISQKLMKWSPDVQKLILEKWLEGDGTWSKVHNNLSGTTSSRILAFQLMTLAARSGMGTSVVADPVRPNQKNRTDKWAYIQKKHTTYVLSFSGGDSEKLEVSKKPAGFTELEFCTMPVGQLRHQVAGRMVEATRARPRIWVEDGFVYRRLWKAETKFIDETVYDLTVPGDHGFMVHGVGVSNCRVKQDRCSICDHASKRSSEYCRHLKQSMCKWLPEHSKFAYAINDKPTFFDISRVKNPADRIAHNIAYLPGELEKAASGEPVFSDEAAAREGVVTRWVRGCSHPGLNRWLEKLAATEVRLNAMQMNPGQYRNDPGLQFFKHAALCAFDPFALDDAGIQALREIEAGALFHGLAKRAAVLPFFPFVAWLSGESLTKLAQDVDVLNAAQRLPMVFQAILAGEHDEALEEQFEPASEKRANLILSDRVDRMLDKVAADWSTHLPHVQARILRVTMTSMPQLKVATTPTPRANQLAQAYAFYKLAAVEAMCQMHGPDCVDEAVELLLLSQHQI